MHKFPLLSSLSLRKQNYNTTIMNLFKVKLIIPAVLISCLAVFSQTGTIYLDNPSFESNPGPSMPPWGWLDCGFPGETPPDVQPNNTFQVTKKAYHGSTYLGMVVRANETWEAVGQRLSSPLRKNNCYAFSVYLSRSETYLSPLRGSPDTLNFDTPIKLRIYGGYGYCDKQYLLAESEIVAHTVWQQYKFKFEPIDNYPYIVLEAFYETPTLFPYNGNILVDYASDIVLIECNDEIPDEIASTIPEPEETPLTEEERIPETSTTPLPPTTPEAPVRTTEEEEISLAGVTREELHTGKSIKIDKLFFEADSSRISEDSYPVLDDIFQFLAVNKDVFIEIGGHTNGLPPHDYADNLSNNRAKAVADYLSNKGIAPSRLKYKGYGKRQPIADNTTVQGRKRNQRVEIKILSMQE